MMNDEQRAALKKFQDLGSKMLADENTLKEAKRQSHNEGESPVYGTGNKVPEQYQESAKQMIAGYPEDFVNRRTEMDILLDIEKMVKEMRDRDVLPKVLAYEKENQMVSDYNNRLSDQVFELKQKNKELMANNESLCVENDKLQQRINLLTTG
jgi:hypothetical protein